MSFLGLLTIILVLCKIFGVIDWSWWLVFSPAILAIIIAVVGFATFIKLTRG